jgi:hypothetical protein
MVAHLRASEVGNVCRGLAAEWVVVEGSPAAFFSLFSRWRMSQSLGIDETAGRTLTLAG